jgi:type II secretory pathway component GspD/PulD (secretin)
VVLQDGQTIVIGGLLKDRTSKVTLKDALSWATYPVLGWLFRRETLQTEKVDLLIFLTASSVPAEGSVLVLTNVNSLARGSGPGLARVGGVDGRLRGDAGRSASPRPRMCPRQRPRRRR